MRSLVRSLPCALLSLTLSGCAEEMEGPSRVDSLRVLAVRSDTPFAAPGSRPELEMLVIDGADPSRDVNVLWFGTCLNPPGDLYHACYPALHAATATLTDDDLAARQVPAGTAEGNLGFGAPVHRERPGRCDHQPPSRAGRGVRLRCPLHVLCGLRRRAPAGSGRQRRDRGTGRLLPARDR